MIWIVYLVVFFVLLFVVMMILYRVRLVLYLGSHRIVLAKPSVFPALNVEARIGKGATASPAPNLPSPALLKGDENAPTDQNAALTQAKMIVGTLQEFGVPASVVEILEGPRITRFGVQPGFIEKVGRNGEIKRRRVKVSAITSLADDLALALATKNLSIESPVPGKSYIGIEVPNRQPQLVTLFGVLTSSSFTEIYKKGGLAAALGRDVVGNPVVADLTKMPHCLIAGATGAGKSVCINAIIASLLFHWTPDQLCLLMIDPKQVELIGYNGIPHLIAPVITDVQKVLGALTWAVGEMERRLQLFSQAGKRHLASYNRWARESGKETLPYLVVIIDELADLMMTAPDEVEPLICRLAQMARATGIHLILATQRPTVNVVTGLIKANIPTRIAFAVASQVDSKVILDTKGAESLLGRGDMLYKAADALHTRRLQGCFVSDEELEVLVAYWRGREVMGDMEELLLEEYGKEVESEKGTPEEDAPIPRKLRRTGHDKLLPEAIALTKVHQTVSISFFQRKLRIGYARAARLVDVLEERGLVGPASRRGREVRKQVAKES